MDKDSPPREGTSKQARIQSYSQPPSAQVSVAATPTTSSRFGNAGEEKGLRSPKKMVITPSWERDRDKELEQVCNQIAASAAAGPKDIDSVSRAKTPLSPQPSSLGFDSRSKTNVEHVTDFLLQLYKLK